MIEALTKLPTRATRTMFAVTAGGILFVTMALLPQLADQLTSWRDLDNAGGLGRFLSKSVDTEIGFQFQSALDEYEALKVNMLTADQLPAVQNELLVVARQYGCQIRRVAIQSGYSETWQPEEQDVENTEPAADFDPLREESDYRLQTELILLNLTGTFEQVTGFVQQVRSKPWLCAFSRMTIARIPEEKGRLSLEATIAFSRLSRKEKPELIQWQAQPARAAVR